MTTPQAHPYPYPSQLDIVCQARFDHVTLIVCGEIDLASVPDLERELRAAESRARHVVLDLAGLEFIDSAGLHALIDAQRRAEMNGHELVFTQVPAHAQRLFRLTGINTRFSIA